MRLINADALWNELEILYEQNKGKVNWNDALMEIKTAPTIEPERKKGKWIDMSDGGRIKTLWAEKYKCDKCGMYGTRAWKFCPYCGADMRARTKEDICKKEINLCDQCKREVSRAVFGQDIRRI